MDSDQGRNMIKRRLKRKLPGEKLTLDEIRELKKIEAESVNDRIKRGIRYEDESQVWWQLWSEGRFLPKNRKLPSIRYLTGLTALNLTMEGRNAPGWHSTYLSNRAS